MLFCILTCVCARGQEVDSTAATLQEVVVTQQRKTVYSKGLDAVITPDAMAIARGSFAEPDVVNMLKRLPGVSSVSDLGSGISVDGADFSQVIFDIDGVPVYFPYRPVGVFSAFNPWHYAKATFTRMPLHGRIEPRLGANVSFQPYSSASEPAGCASVGLLSSNIALRTNVGSRLFVSAAARVSYIEKVYGRHIRNDSGGFNADFYDLNFSATYRIDSLNQLSLNAFRSQDKLRYDNSDYMCDMRMLWHNNLASVKWHRNGASKIEQSFYLTSFDNDYNAQITDFEMLAPSAMRQYGLQGSLTKSAKAIINEYTVGYSADVYDIVPMWIKSAQSKKQAQTGFAARAYAGVNSALGRNCSIEGVLSVIYWHNGGYNRLLPSPRLTFRLERDNWRLGISGALAWQYLHRIGFAEIGAATDFWFGANDAAPVQSGLGVSVDYTRQIGPSLSLTVGAYCRRVRHQSEYVGTTLDLLYQDYDYKSHVIMSNGYNAGVSLSAEYTARAVNASLAYNYGVARRRYEPGKPYCFGNTDPGHSLKLGLEGLLSPRWSLTADFTLASGRRYTPIEQIYLISSNVIAVYGERNSGRLPLYHRLDLGARFRITRPGSNRRFEQSLALGLLNAYGSKNVESRYYGFKVEDNTYTRYDKGSLYRFLPSISYMIKF